MGASLEFDKKVHHKDSKGVLVREDAYRLRVWNGLKLFERPKGSGIFYYESGERIPDSELKRLRVPKWPKLVTPEVRKKAVEALKDEKIAKLQKRVAELEANKAREEYLLKEAEVDVVEGEAEGLPVAQEPNQEKLAEELDQLQAEAQE